MNKTKRIKHLDSEEEFRARVLSALEVDKHALYLFVDDEVYEENRFVEMDFEDIGSAIKNSKQTEKISFESLLSSVAETRIGRERFWNILLRYCPNIQSIDNKGLVEAISTRFFQSVWPEGKGFEISRREDEEYINELSDRLCHVVIFKKSVTIDVAMIILSFLNYDYQLMCNLGVVSVQWFRLILSTWPHADLSLENFLKIPISVLNKVKILRFSGLLSKTQKPVTNDPIIFNYTFKYIDPQRINELNFQKLYIESEDSDTYWKSPKRIEFPNCQVLKTGNDPNFWKFMKNISLPRITNLECFFLDLHDARGWKIINFKKVRCLSIVMKNSCYSQTSYYAKYGNPRFKDNLQPSDYESCLLRLYEINDLEKLIFDFGCARPKGFHQVSTDSQRKYINNLITVDLLKFHCLEEVEVLSTGEICNYRSPYRIHNIYYGILAYFNPFSFLGLTSPPSELRTSFNTKIRLTWRCRPYDFTDERDKDYTKILVENEGSFRKINLVLTIPKDEYLAQDRPGKLRNYDWSNVRFEWVHVEGALKFVHTRRNIHGKFELYEKVTIEMFIPFSPIQYSIRRSKRRSGSKFKKDQAQWIWRKVVVEMSFGNDEGRSKVKVLVEGRRPSRRKYKLMERSRKFLKDCEETINEADFRFRWVYPREFNFSECLFDD